MTPENWPEAFGHSHSADGYQPLYTATQVREIVRMEVETLLDAAEDGLGHAETALHDWDRQFQRHPATESGRKSLTDSVAKIQHAVSSARKWLKENKDAD